MWEHSQDRARQPACSPRTTVALLVQPAPQMLLLLPVLLVLVLGARGLLLLTLLHLPPHLSWLAAQDLQKKWCLQQSAQAAATHGDVMTSWTCHRFSQMQWSCVASLPNIPDISKTCLLWQSFGHLQLQRMQGPVASPDARPGPLSPLQAAVALAAPCPGPRPPLQTCKDSLITRIGNLGASNTT